MKRRERAGKTIALVTAGRQPSPRHERLRTDYQPQQALKRCVGAVDKLNRWFWVENKFLDGTHYSAYEYTNSKGLCVTPNRVQIGEGTASRQHNGVQVDKLPSFRRVESSKDRHAALPANPVLTEETHVKERTLSPTPSAIR